MSSGVGTAQVYADEVHAPYDLRQRNIGLATQALIEILPGSFHIDHADAPLDYATFTHLHVVGGFSQGMGDAVMGIGLLDYVRQQYGTQIHVFLAHSMPDFVYEIYQLAQQQGIVQSVQHLPCALNIVAGDATATAVADLSDLFGHVFRDGPIIDLYARALGLNPAVVPLQFKRPGWLKTWVAARPISRPPYCLWVSQSREAFKSVPSQVIADAIHTLVQRRGMTVYGFDADIELPGYQNIRAQSTNAMALINLIAHAEAVYSVDTAAMHIAAGCEVPTTAFVVTPYWQTWCEYYLDQNRFKAVPLTETTPSAWRAALNAAMS